MIIFSRSSTPLLNISFYLVEKFFKKDKYLPEMVLHSEARESICKILASDF